MNKTLMIFILLVTAINLSAQNVSVGDSIKIPSNAGEAQSTVVPPNKKTQCQQGRILISNDNRRPPDSVVSGNNLDQPGGPIIQSKFDMGLINQHFDKALTKTKYRFGTNDHDLVTLSNGDVLYITGAWSSMPVFPPVTHAKPPAWFADTFRCTEAEDLTCLPNKAFGPGARAVVLVFRSTDCGETFTCVSEMDPAHELDGSCAFPQFRRNPDIKTQIFMKPWDMGGTDGQLVKVDPANDRVYMTFQCVGYNPDESKKPGFVPNNADPLNKTIVGMFDAPNQKWTSFGFIDVAAWRFNVIPLGGDELGFGYGNAVLFGKKNAAGKYEFDSTGQAAPVGTFSWMTEGDIATTNPNIPVASIHANVWAVPVLTRTPISTSFMLAFPDRFGAKGLGYRFYFLDRTATEKNLVEQKAVLPATAGKDNFVFQLTAIDLGVGPVLLYWYDVDSAAKTFTIRGRFVTGKAEYSPDFVISQQGGATQNVALTAEYYWFGDYKTGGGYLSSSNLSQGQGLFKFNEKTATFHYYPIWIDPHGSVSYASVQYAVDKMLLSPSAKAKPLPLVTTPTTAWKRWGPPIQLRQVHRPERRPENEVERDMSQPQRVTKPVSPLIKPRQ